MASAHPSGSDPRVSIGAADVRPIVAAPPRNVPWWVFAGSLALAAMLLFAMLDSRRRALTAPATTPRATDAYARAGDAPAALFVPPEPAPAPVVAIPAPRLPPVIVPAPRAAPAPRYYPPAGPPPQIAYPQPVLPAPPASVSARRGTASPALVFDATRADTGAEPAGAAAAGRDVNASVTSDRARASVIRNRANTVAQGTLIPAILETALDSTRPGLVRALVQRDVVGFDGGKVLIPRGSRLVGQYRADLAPGQNRASVIWNRLVRPDGATIALASPAADTLGRGGIKGKVNSHFLERFGAAILQSTLDLGVNLASRVGSNSNSVVVGLPLGQGTQSLIGGNRQVQPTLTVRQGTTIMVFVARDLDFTGVEGR